MYRPFSAICWLNWTFIFDDVTHLSVGFLWANGMTWRVVIAVSVFVGFGGRAGLQKP
jgi:hypothetical protein